MDPFTHALSGALLARAAATTQSHQTALATKTIGLPVRLQVAAGFAAAAFPDIDFALRLFDTLTYLNWHQGPTHSLVLLPFWAWLLALLFAWLTGRTGSQRYGWRLFYLPVCLGLAIHIAGDFITSYGLMLFAPLSTERYALPLAFVIDPWFTLIILIGLIAAWRWPRRRTAAAAALCILAGYVVFLSMLRTQALEIAQHFASSIPDARISALPQPLSPYHWKVIVEDSGRYHVALIDLGADKTRQNEPANRWLLLTMNAAYRPVTDIHWQLLKQFGDDIGQSQTIHTAWQHPAFKPFRVFARYPLLERIDQTDNMLCYWFYDMRFKFPELPPSFQFGLCRPNDASDWRMVRHRGLFYID
ncbi:metal-dependent hydrolase [Nitrosomonas sp.]|uniref:metal-dependent hydrolase n=1 Tax=Nitrosomonas sp. TaxID=42353 RepID=UPI001E048648|nr:metal-dependent hydrolase [Nitrosomonas sp.]MCB1949011.1 metal-dependent hydrolase [Nitrosomonas sp.]MCP5243254.1 metal-dependent hydrolase [Burkholderiales bacterium]MDR4514031.1 metal-dependent hydrolase [Nitrosomonas sp.]